MLPYISVFFMLMIIPKFFKYKNRNLVCFIILLIFMGIRFDVGFDFQGYYNLAKQFSIQKYNLFITRQEVNEAIYGNAGWLWQYYRREFFNRIIYQIAWRLEMPQLTIALYSFLSLLFIKKGIDNIETREEKKYIWLFFYTFPLFFLLFTNFMRQAVAVSIIFYAYKYVVKGQIVRFIFFIFLASMFHKTAIFMLIIYIVKKIKIKKYSVYILTYIFCLFGKKIIIFFMKNIYIFHKYITYINGNYQIGGEKIYYVIFFLGILLILFKEKILQNNKQLIFSYNLVFIGCCLYVALKGTGHLMYRVGLYFLIFLLYLIPRGIQIIREIKIYKYFKILYYSICFSMLILALLIDKNSTRPQYVPYDTFITNEEKIFYKVKK